VRDPDTGLPMPARHRVVRHDQLPSTQGVVAFISGQTRDGPWRLSPSTRVVTVLGSAELDLREAELSEGESVIEIFCLLGSVEIIVPPGVRVLNEGDSLAGNFAMKAGDWDAAPDAPVVRVIGSAYLGDVEIRQQAFGESERAARKRLKRLRKG
jgi:Cell wall-active antibiotics response LiaF, C-terminal